MKKLFKKGKYLFLILFVLALIASCIAIGFGVIYYLENEQKSDESSDNGNMQEMKVVVLKGEVKVKEPEMDEIEVTAEKVVVEGTELSTDGNSQALLIFEDNSSVTLDANTTLVLTQSTIEENSTSTQIEQKKGNIWVRVKKLAGFSSEFEVESPNVVASVRGTAFSIDINDGYKLVTEENNVDVFMKDDSEEKINVKEGEGVELVDGELEKRTWDTKTFNPEWDSFNVCLTNQLEGYLEGDNLTQKQILEKYEKSGCELAKPAPQATDDETEEEENTPPPPAAVVLTRPTVTITSVKGRSSVAGKVTTKDTEYKNFIVALGSKVGGTDVKNWFSVDKAGLVSLSGLKLEHGKTYYLSAITKGLDGKNSPVGSDSFKVNAPYSADVTLNQPAGMPYWSTDTINGTLSLTNLTNSEVTMRASLYNSGSGGGTGYWNGSGWSATPYWYSVTPASSYSYTYPATTGTTYYVTIKVQVLYKGAVLDEALVSGIIKT